MTLLPDSINDKARVLELFVLKMQTINKTEGRVFGSYQILDVIEDIAIKEGMVECPTCGRKHP